ncbi:MAG: ATP phosphoribosyltransferase regulatory subunit [Caulobacteraceae bacterium]
MRLEGAIPPEILAAVRAPFVEAGGTSIVTPMAEPLGHYLDLAGEAMRERLFLVQGPGREEYCLRPDFTLGIAFAHIASGAASGRYVYEGPAFRVAPPGSARAEQFLQIGLEAYGTSYAPLADASMASLAWRAASAGGRDDLSLLLGDVALFGAFLAALGVPGPAASRLQAALSRPARLARELAQPEPRPETKGRLAEILVDLDEARAVAVLEEIWTVAGIEPVGGRGAAEIVHRLTTRAAAVAAPPLERAERELIGRYLAIDDEPRAALAAVADLASGPTLDAALAAWKQRGAALSEIPATRTRLVTAFHRPFGYYDGMLFEVRSEALGEDQAVAAGGRYDGLPARLGAAPGGRAVGCVVRPGRAWREGRS